MEPRFPKSEAPNSDSVRTVELALHALHSGPPPFKWADDSGETFLGCYAPLSYTPGFVDQFFQLAKTLYSDTVVKPRNREMAILGLASVLDVPYIVYCHRRVAAKMGVTEEQYQQGLDGTVPGGTTPEEAMAYRLGRILPTLTGRLDEDTWKEATAVMDKAQIVGVMHTLAGYRWVALLEQLNGDVTREWS